MLQDSYKDVHYRIIYNKEKLKKIVIIKTEDWLNYGASMEWNAVVKMINKEFFDTGRCL